MKNILLFLGVFLVVAILSVISCKHEPVFVNLTGTGQGPPPPPVGHSCSSDTVYFYYDVLPILLSSCAKTGCHDGTGDEAALLSSYQAVMNSGYVSQGNPGNSRLYTSLSGGGENKMPPPPNTALSTAQAETIQKWIQQGALYLLCDVACDSNTFTFSGAIWPNTIQKYCYGCHSGSGASGGVHLENYNDVKTAGSIAPGQKGSLLGTIIWAAGNSPMPKGQNKLSDCQIVQIRKWINDGMPNN
jgi:hypothetical protein